ncbi:MAG: hypothetical protein QG671_767, partial [Actinomycetota bacterium]|nr:hypothetical protein [Actinomycetota bacterium]
MSTQPSTAVRGKPLRFDRSRAIRRAGWTGLGLAAATFAAALLSWPTGLWEAAALAWSWYPMSGWVALLGLLTCLASTFLLLD